jgi:hypothetical protein
MSISEYVMECVREKFQENNIPNENTKEALKESESGKGVKTHSNIKELFSDLEI